MIMDIKKMLAIWRALFTSFIRHFFVKNNRNILQRDANRPDLQFFSSQIHEIFLRVAL